jgi:hypothetical protein
MNFSLKIKEDYPAKSFGLSIVVHILLFVGSAIILRLNFEESRVASQYVQITTSEIETVEEESKPEEEMNIADETEPAIDNTPLENIEKPEKELIEEKTADNFLAFSIETADTSALNQIYKESTLKVSIKYPTGWTYIDQNVKNKLDGVTFWLAGGNYSPPPYVHLEVKEKYLFNPSRYQYNMNARNYTIYYNEPEELEGQVSQTLYIRTDTEEDYSIKLIMEGRSAFRSFQSDFFGMVKSFKFGNSLF